MSAGRLFAVALAAALAGCTVGPEFKPPVVSAPPAFAPEPQDVASRTFGGAVDAAWWRSFGDAELDSLVARLAAQNLDLQEAAERVQQARAETRVTRAQGLPQVNAAPSYENTRQSANGFLSLEEPVPGAPFDYSTWTAQLTASWEIDLFGRVRRAVEAREADTQATVEARRGLALMAIADLAQDYMRYRGAQARVAIAKADLAVSDHNLSLVQDRFGQGVATTLDVANARARRAQTAAALPDLVSEEARLVNAIGLLLALAPRALAGELSAAAPVPHGPASIGVGVPGDLVRRRPDVREAEARLHAATAQTGVAVANFYPDVTLKGDAGYDSLHLDNLFDASSRMFDLGPSVTLPIFQGGRLKATLQLRRSQQKEAALAFRRTVLRAWSEVDDALTAYAEAQHTRVQDAAAVRQDEVALDAAQQRFAQGAVDFLNVTSAQAALLNDRDRLVEADAMVSGTLVALYRSLGGGWRIADGS